MAQTFKNRVEGLTGLVFTAESRPSLNDLDQYLKDGQRDISNRLKVLDPGSLINITTTATGIENISIPSGLVLQVERENGNTGQYVKASLADPSLQNEITRTSSIYYQSAHHPVYYIQNNTLTVLPAAQSDGGSTKVTYVKYDDDVTHESKEVGDYTEKYRDMLVHYCSIRALRVKLINMTLEEEDVELSPVLTQTMQEIKSYYDQGFLSPQAMEQDNQQQQQRRE
mgnify:CR=1 FL=1